MKQLLINYTMKRFFMNIKSVVVMATTALVALSSVSCQYDDTALWDEVNNLKQELAALQEKVDSELAAINELVNGLVTIKDVVPQSDGSKLITLSDGTKISIYPKADKVPANIVTVYSDGGVLYWAMYDGTGQAKPIMIGNNMIPVADVAPRTQVVDGAIEVSFDGGNTWIKTGYTESVADSIISDVEVVYSDWQTDSDGNPVALYFKLTLADGSIVKVGMQNGKLVLPYDMVYVPYGSDMIFAINVDDVADFMTTTPRGWECEVEHNAKENSMALRFYAPEFDAVESGAAAREGVMKLMVVFNNGTSAIASIKVSTNPANVYYTMEGVYVEIGYGTNYILCGIIPTNSFELETVATACEKVLNGGTSSYVYQVSFMEERTAFVKYKDMRSQGVVAGTEYTFWYVSPRENEAGDLVVSANEFILDSYVHSSASFSVTAPSFFDVDVKFNVVGSQGYMLGYAKADEFDAAALAEYYTENYDYLNATRTDISYTGSLLELMESSSKLVNGTEYVLWYIAKNKSHVILEENVLYWPFTTKDFTNDGTLEMEIVGEPQIEYKDIYVTLNSNGEHMMLIYNAMPSYMASAYPDDTYIVNMLLSEGVRTITEDSVEAHYKGTEPGEKVTLFAVAVDKDGKVGKPMKKEYTTKNFEYNDLVVTLNLEDYKVDNTLISVACEGSSHFKYIYCSLDDSKWKELYGGTAKKAGEYIIMNPNGQGVYDTQKTPLVDGNIFLNGLNVDTEYVLVCVAVDENDMVSTPATIYFEPIANIGNMVKRSDANWAEGKPEIILGTITEVEFYNFAWYTVPQKGYVAYSMVDHPYNLVSDYYGTNVNTPEKLIAYIVAGCDNGRKDCGHKCEYSEDGYSRSWQEMEDLNGDGRIESHEWVTYTEDNLPGVYNSYFYGTKDEHRIYVTWVGEDGNFHEPFVYNPTTDEEEELNAVNFPGYFE